jgi:hypothetical protein
MTICPHCRRRTTRHTRPSQDRKARWCALCGKLLPRVATAGRQRPTPTGITCHGPAAATDAYAPSEPHQIRRDGPTPENDPIGRFRRPEFVSTPPLNHVTGQEHTTMNMTERQAVILGLRALADFLAAHPQVPIKHHTLNEFVDTRDEWDTIAATDAAWIEQITDEFRVLKCTFAGGITLDVNLERAADESDPETADPSRHAFTPSTLFADCCATCGESEAAHGDALIRALMAPRA